MAGAKNVDVIGPYPKTQRRSRSLDMRVDRPEQRAKAGAEVGHQAVLKLQAEI